MHGGGVHGLTRFVIVALIVGFAAIAMWGAYKLTVESSNVGSLFVLVAEHGLDGASLA
jgi:TRAP-type C4-dicarboxylate transport system permease small subunit